MTPGERARFRPRSSAEPLLVRTECGRRQENRAWRHCPRGDLPHARPCPQRQNKRVVRASRAAAPRARGRRPDLSDAADAGRGAADDASGSRFASIVETEPDLSRMRTTVGALESAASPRSARGAGVRRAVGPRRVRRSRSTGSPSIRARTTVTVHGRRRRAAGDPAPREQARSRAVARAAVPPRDALRIAAAAARRAPRTGGHTRRARCRARAGHSSCGGVHRDGAWQ